MKRSGTILFLVALVATGITLFYILRIREPSYEGRLLTDWVNQGTAAYISDDVNGYTNWQTASNAVYQMGAKAIPTLLRWANARDPKPQMSVIKWLHENLSRRLHIHIYSEAEFQFKGQELRSKGQWGLAMLDDKAKAAWPVLISRTFDRDPRRRLWALDDLRSAKADKQTLLPVLLRMMKDPNQEVGLNAAVDFQLIAPQDAKAAGVYELFPDLKPLAASETKTDEPAAKLIR